MLKNIWAHTLRFVLHKCPKETYYPRWTRLINRQGFSVTKHTRVCSNHFQYGQPREQDPHPSLFSKGYQCQPRRKPPARRDQPFLNDTCKEDEIDSGADLPTSSTKTKVEYENEIDLLKQQNKNDKINSVESEIPKLKTGKSFGIHALKHSDYLIYHLCIFSLDI